jgi:hypothetical protein
MSGGWVARSAAGPQHVPSHGRPRRSHGQPRPAHGRSTPSHGQPRPRRLHGRRTRRSHGQPDGRTASPSGRRASPSGRMGAALFAREDQHPHATLATCRERSRTHAWAKPCLAGPPGARTARNVPRCHPDSHMGEALFGGPTLGARTNAISRAEHFAWPPDWDGAS